MLNHINIMGNLVANPELRSTANGTKVASLRIACGRDYGGKGEDRITDFFDVVAWRATAEFVCRNFTKGQPILISGRLASRNWEDKEGKKRVSIEIVADEVYFAGGSRSKADTSGGFTELGDDDGELPWDNTTSDIDLPL